MALIVINRSLRGSSSCQRLSSTASKRSARAQRAWQEVEEQARRIERKAQQFGMPLQPIFPGQHWRDANTPMRFGMIGPDDLRC